MIVNYREFVTGKYKEHVELTPHQARLLDWTVGLAGEAGEVSELIKHHVYSDEELDKMKVAKELGDVMWYITALADTCGIKIEDILALNMAKLQHRHGCKFSTEASKDRHAREEVFEETPIYKTIRNNIMKGVE